jgi:carboxyl-terminal processing protease
VSELEKKSSTRIAKSEDFKKLESKIQDYLKEKDKKSITLNEKKFFERDLDTEKENEKALEEQVNGSQKIKRDFYLNEVMAITADYTKLLKESESVN